MKTLLPGSSSRDDWNFIKKVLIACSVIAVFVLMTWFFIITFRVLLLILAGVLIALYFNGLAALVERTFVWPQKFSLVFSILFTFLIIGVSFWFMGATIQQQVTELVKTLPDTIGNLKNQLSTSFLGQKLLERTSSTNIYNKGYAFLGTFFNSSFGVFTDIYIVLFLGLFFTTAPMVYVNGFLLLVPPTYKVQTVHVFEKIAYTLTKWLKGQMFAMLIVAILKGVALSILNVPMAIALALIAGILNFIPNFGPLISMFPAILIALTQSINKAIVVTIVYLIIQIIEGNVITTTIQRRLINMPAAITIIAQLFMGLLAGVWGLILATPLVAIVMVIVKETYVKSINKTEIEVINS